ncbi:hypothetical protein [Nonomuraea guangzhouensis]|uniref:Uncharacterized protein n=1 Tax=Nonomuraea guangzhouensis TaxID=1291555 RepID=A0ABW4G9G7_9ACTN|nr:hypothetical protein [Nonomuraea guangzhouensis]
MSVWAVAEQALLPKRAGAGEDRLVVLADDDMLDGAQATTYPGMPWEPKEAFHTLARHYASRTTTATTSP